MAKLLSGTRIYGTANVDTSVYIGTSNTTTGTGGVLANTTAILIGNSSVNAQISTTALNINTAFVANATGVYTTGLVNATSFTVGTTFVANSLGTYIGTSNVIANSAGFFVANVTGVVSVVNTTGNSVLTATTLKVANSTSNLFWVNTTTVAFGNGVGIFANGGLGTANQVLTTNGTGVYWSTVSAGGGVTSLTAGNGITVSASTGAVTVSQDIYTGSTQLNATYPIGTTVISLDLDSGCASTPQNTSRSIYVQSGNFYMVFRSLGGVISGTALTGTWRSRGQIPGSWGYLFQRTA